MFITFAICTHNRSAFLRECLESFAMAERPPTEWQVLVVDNASTDDTTQVALSFANRLPLRVVRETRIGHSAARNRAIREARGELLVFTDDDVRIDAEWFRAYAVAATEWPQAAFFGGSIIPRFVGGRPAWLTDELAIGPFNGVCIWRQVRGPPMVVRDWSSVPWGANFGFRLPLPEGLCFREDLGLRPGSLVTNEEIVFMQGFLDRGVSGVLLPGAVVYHVTPASRLQAGYLFRHGMGKGQADARCGFVARPDAGRWSPWWPNWYVRRTIKQTCRTAWRALTVPKGERMVMLYEYAKAWGQIREWCRQRPAGIRMPCPGS